MTCNHSAAPHLLAWNNRWAGTDVRFVEAIRTALAHVDEDDLEPGDLDAIDTLLARADRLYFGRNLRARRPTDSAEYAIPADDAELAAAERVLESACRYMSDNHYASDGEFPEDRRAAQALGETGVVATSCWVGAFAAAHSMADRVKAGR